MLTHFSKPVRFEPGNASLGNGKSGNSIYDWWLMENEPSIPGVAKNSVLEMPWAHGI